MCDYYVEMMCVDRFELGWAHDIFTVTYHMLMHFSCIRIFISLYLILICLVLFCLSLSPFLSLFLLLVALWHLNENPLHPGTLFVPRHLLLLPSLILLHFTFGSVMIKPVRNFRRTSHDEAFIQNAKSFYQIFQILTFPLSSTVGVGNHCVASQSLVPLWSYKIFTRGSLTWWWHSFFILCLIITLSQSHVLDFCYTS